MTFNDAKVAGTLLILGGVQFVIALIIAEAIYPGYSISVNYISDLGVWGRPSAIVFNPSILLFGLTVLASSYFIHRQFHNRALAVLFAISGAGTLGVGLFPENTFILNGLPIIHSLSALLAFVVGGITAVAAYKITKAPFRYLSIIMGAATLTAFVLFITTSNSGALGIGAGGLERMMAYPTLLWIIGFGGYLLGFATEKQKT
jgi:hypothetical membrane protein